MDTDPLLSLFTPITFTPPTPGAIAALLLATLLLAVSGFISASEIAFFSLDPKERAAVAEGNHRRDKLITALLDRSEHLLATILIANNLVNVGVIILCNYFISTTFNFTTAPVVGYILQTVVLTFLLLLFGEIMPKIYATHNALRFARRSAPVLNRLLHLFSPFANLLVRSTRTVNRRMSTHKNSSLSIDDLSDALEMTRVEQNDEKELLEGIIKFGDTTVSEIMTPRVDITDVDIHLDFKALVARIIDSGYSRIPVYDGSQDAIKGVIYSKDLLPHLHKDIHFRWQTLLRPPYFVPENKPIDKLLEEFRTNKIHLAVVVDEFGGTSGIVSLEDILEEIVGEISDEYDDEETAYEQEAPDTYIVKGKILLNDFFKISGIEASDFSALGNEAETLAGLVLEIKEDFPKPKEEIRYGRYTFTVLEADKRRIIKLKVRIDPAEPAD